MNIPANISDLSLTFFAKGRPWTLPSDNPNFLEVRTMLTTGNPDLDRLIELADIRVQLRNAGLEFVDDAMLYNGTELHNVWVDKILKFREDGVPFDAVFKALDNLLTNPTQAAIDRLPAFVEKSKLGFLPDGRIAAYKGVRKDGFDVHTGSVHYEVGGSVEIPRELCEQDPNVSCAAGLHVGAITYIKSMGYGWGADRKLLLCAVWPSDFVAVPYDYHGEKCRVCKLDVIDEVDPKFAEEHLGSNQTVVGWETTPSAPAPEPTKAPWELAKVGDWVEVSEGSYVPAGNYKVTRLELNDSTDCRVCVSAPGQYYGGFGIWNKNIVRILPPPPAYTLAVVGDLVSVSGVTQTVVAIDPEPDSDTRLKVRGSYGDRYWADNCDVEAIVTNDPAFRAKVGDRVRIEGEEDIEDDTYEVTEIDDADATYRVCIKDTPYSVYFVKNDTVKEVLPG